MRVLLLVLAYVLNGGISYAQSSNNWQLYQEQNNVRVEYRKNNDNLLQISAKVTVNSGIGAFLHLLEDTTNIRSWLVNSQSAAVLAQPDLYTHIVHTQFNAIWPVSPRDIITRSVWSQHPDTLVLTLHVTDMGQQYAATKGYIRMQQVQGQWTLTPLAQQKLLISYQGQADPSGRLPHFISNNVALKSTFQTFNNIPNVLANYQKPYANIIEP